ncbi:MAG: 3-mercaptopyruvate sulfurtransferase [Planktomarina sp.]
MDTSKTIVSTQWVANNLASGDVRLLDGSWHMPATGRDAAQEFTAQHIPGASFFDIDLISDTTSDLPHMAPSAAEFAQHVGAMGISNDTQVVVYDTVGIFSAARVWWLFKLMGHENVAVLNGGLPKWIAEGRDVTNTPTQPQKAAYTSNICTGLVKDATDIQAAIKAQTPQILDARSPARFNGEAAEPRVGLRAGHMPGSVNVPFQDVLNSDGTLKAVDDLRQTFVNAGVDLGGPIITSCGSGVTAAILFLALTVLGKTDVALYDGSWSEWGGLPDSEIITK